MSKKNGCTSCILSDVVLPRPSMIATSTVELRRHPPRALSGAAACTGDSVVMGCPARGHLGSPRDERYGGRAWEAARRAGECAAAQSHAPVIIDPPASDSVVWHAGSVAWHAESCDASWVFAWRHTTAALRVWNCSHVTLAHSSAGSQGRHCPRAHWQVYPEISESPIPISPDSLKFPIWPGNGERIRFPIRPRTGIGVPA